MLHQRPQGGGASAKKTATKKATTTKKTTAKKATTTKKASTAKTTTKKTATAKKATAKQQAATKTASAAATKAEQRQEERQEQYGLMPSELDNLNHNVFHADAAAIKGALDTESALRYLPFVTIVNTAGFGSQFDLRGQGRLSANGVQLYINGVPSNPVDTYHSAMPINTVIPRLIQDIEVFPGSGAILYGSGTKGGTINIITSKRQAPYFLVGGGYVNTMATEGHSFNVFASAAENLGQHAKMNAGLAFSQMGGPREGDSQMGGEVVIGAFYDIGWGQYLNFDLDVYYGKNKTTPYNSLINESVLSDMMLKLTPNIPGQGGLSEANRYLCLGTHGTLTQTYNCPYNLYDFKPNKENRADAGNGKIDTSHIRVTGKIGWQLEDTQKLQFNVDAFYNLNYTKYNTYQMNLPYFVFGWVEMQQVGDQFLPNISSANSTGYSWFLPRPRPNGEIPTFIGDGQRADWHYFDQSGSTFSDNKFGVNANMTYKHDDGVFIVGLSSHYEMSNKKQNSHLRQAITDGYLFGKYTGANNDTSSSFFAPLVLDIYNKTDISTITSAIFILENYRFNKNFSLMAGARYEMKNYDLKITDEFSGYRLQFANQDGSYAPSIPGNGGTCTGENCGIDYNTYRVVDGSEANQNVSGDFNKNFDNFTFELAPVLKYSNTGSVYARGEFGYIAPPAWAMLQRVGNILGCNNNRQCANTWAALNARPGLDFQFGFIENEIKSESYWTAELGWKELIGSRRIPLGFTNFNINAMLFSANIFYTDSKNEFYFTGDTWSGMHFGNYDKSRRMGAEVAFEQYLLGGVLGLNESFTYIKAEQQENSQWQPIPYTYDFKATLGANVNVAAFIEIVDVSINIWLQNSIYGNQQVYSTNIVVNDDGFNMSNVRFEIVETDNTKLKPYVISDFGVSVGLNKNAVLITTGIKNIFDTFYYDYYNNDRSAVVNENRYVIGRGRTVFVEGQYRY